MKLDPIFPIKCRIDYHCSMKKCYHLATCSTCQLILKDSALAKKGYDLQDIKNRKNYRLSIRRNEKAGRLI